MEYRWEWCTSNRALAHEMKVAMQRWWDEHSGQKKQPASWPCSKAKLDLFWGRTIVQAWWQIRVRQENHMS